MKDPDVKLGWKIIKALRGDESEAAFEARLAVHSLVWTIWQLRAELAAARG